MKSPRVTSFDVAKKAGVSRTTVSMVLNNPNHDSIRKETRLRVLDAAASLGYTPNSAARTLVRGNSETVGLVISNAELLIADAFVPQLLCGINLALASFGYRMLVEVVDDVSNPSAYLELIASKRIDGLIVLSPRIHDTALWRLIDSGFPVVLVGSSNHPNEYSVRARIGIGIREAINHLVSLGHRRIGHVGYAPPELTGACVRREKYRQALRLAKLEPDDRLETFGAWSVESGYRAMNELLDRKLDLSAVFAGNDTLAMGAMAAIRGRGLSIPDDISIIGFDDLPFSAFTDPPLTTVSSPAIPQGRAAADLLVRLMREETISERTIHIPTKFVLRQSTGPCPSSN